MKKTITIILVVLVIALAAWLFWQWTAEPEETPAGGTGTVGGGLTFPSGQVDNNTGTGPGGALTVSSSTNAGPDGSGPIGTFSNFNQVSDQAIAGATLIGSSTVIYMEKATGHIYTVDMTGDR